MLQGWVIVLVAFAYLGVLFAVAYYGDRRAEARRSIIANPYVYALSMAVYCTTWTFYGSVGRAACHRRRLPAHLPRPDADRRALVVRAAEDHPHQQGVPHHVDRRLHRQPLRQERAPRRAGDGDRGARHRPLHLAAAEGDLRTASPSSHYPNVLMPSQAAAQSFASDTALYIALILAAFTIVFGTRHLDATERHEGMVAAIAFESVVKLLAFLAVGAFVTFGVYDGFGDIFRLAQQDPGSSA